MQGTRTIIVQIVKNVMMETITLFPPIPYQGQIGQWCGQDRPYEGVSVLFISFLLSLELHYPFQDLVYYSGIQGVVNVLPLFFRLYQLGLLQ